ncbi:MAG: UvrD-helicase domain-containing protein [Candidatus Omnitrophota bacterium]|nr:UvrD-helicase domain-containing protein [Candidatus Omnitrophota bacterium]
MKVKNFSFGKNLKNMIKPPDQKQRSLIASELTTSFFVEAGAGSGKTHSLVDRMAGLILHGHAKIENVVAVTFTRKAAAELRERFQIRLEELLHNQMIGEVEKNNINEALLSLERALISTVHAFCAKILRERPVEAGIDPGFEEVEESEDIILAGRVWSEYIEKQGLIGDSAIGWMQDNGIDYKSLKDIFMKLVRYPDVQIFTESICRPDFTEVKRRINNFLVEIGKEIPKAEPDGGWDKMQVLIRRGLKLIDLGYLGEDRLFINLLTILNKTSPVVQKKWPDKVKAKQLEADLQQFQQQVIILALQQWKEYLHKPLIDFALGGAKYYEEWRRERSILNFQDLLMKSAALLRNNEEVRAYFKKNISYLLVDEFQDTDPIQAEIVMLLTGVDNSINDWRKIKPRPGSLFLVGDPKQSIFRFRRADIDIYNQVKDIFKNGAGMIVELTSNFRSFDHIANLTNSVFKDIFPENDSQYQARFAPLVTVRGPSKKDINGIIGNILLKVPRNDRKQIVQEDANIIARWIYDSVNGRLKLERTKEELQAGESEDAKPGDFMIIAKKKDMLSVYARALEALGIPYEITGGESFRNSIEMCELYKLFKAVADPKDPVVLVAALRGLFFGVSDDELYQFTRQGGRFTVFSSFDKGPAKIIEAFKKIKEYCDIVAKNSPMSALEKITEQLGVIPLSVSEEMGASKAGNILKAIELLRGKRADMTGSFPELVEYLNELLTIESIEEMSLFQGTTKAVRIMNLHKVKGLEAPVVILVDPLGLAKDHEPQIHVKRTLENSVGYFLVSKPSGDYGFEIIGQPRGWDGHASEEILYDAAERNRLDYVAATRAKNILVVSVYTDGDKRKAWESLYSYLHNATQLKTNSLPEQKGRETFKISQKDIIKGQTDILNVISLLNEPTYRTTSVTELIDKVGIFQGEAAEGSSWGRIMHKALEVCGKGKRDKLEILVKSWLVDEERPHEDLQKVLKLVDGIMQSDMWHRVLKSEEKYFELPFSTLNENEVISGTIDLIFKESDAWVIVDYKTDNFEANPKKKEAYEKQLNIYSLYWEKLTGGIVKEKKLYRVG